MRKRRRQKRDRSRTVYSLSVVAMILLAVSSITSASQTSSKTTTTTSTRAKNFVFAIGGNPTNCQTAGNIGGVNATMISQAQLDQGDPCNSIEYAKTGPLTNASCSFGTPVYNWGMICDSIAAAPSQATTTETTTAVASSSGQTSTNGGGNPPCPAGIPNCTASSSSSSTSSTPSLFGGFPIGIIAAGMVGVFTLAYALSRRRRN